MVMPRFKCLNIKNKYLKFLFSIVYYINNKMVKIIVGDSDRMATNKAMIREGTHMRMPKVNLKAVAHEQDHKPAPRLHNNAVISGNGLAGGSLAGGSMVHHPSNLERLIMASKQKSMSNLDFHKKARGK